MTVPGELAMIRRRRLLRREITYSSAKDHEANILHQLGYYNKQCAFYENLQQNIPLIRAIVARHLNLGNLKHCRVGGEDEWMAGSFNVCVPVYLSDSETSGDNTPIALFRVPFPHRVGEKENPGNSDEKILCEAGAYAWLQHNCPDIPIPHLFGFGLSNGRIFTHLNNLPLCSRIFQSIRRRLFKFLGYTSPTLYVPRGTMSTLESGYLLVEYIDRSKGQMLSTTWAEKRNDARLRKNLFTSLSSIYLSLTSTTIERIASFVIDDEGFLKHSNRPLTLEIMDFENQGIPSLISRDFTYTTTDAYVNDILRMHEERVDLQPNAVNDREDCIYQIAALTLMRTVRQCFFDQNLRRGPFFMSLTDLHQSNILVDNDWNITCLIDLEWACSRPVEMIRAPHWLSDQAVAQIDPTDYHEMLKEFVKCLEVQESKVSPTPVVQLSLMLPMAFEVGTSWYTLALDCPAALFKLFYRRLLPKFSTDITDDEPLWKLTVDCWGFDSTGFIQRKVYDKTQYDTKLLEAFIEEER